MIIDTPIGDIHIPDNNPEVQKVKTMTDSELMRSIVDSDIISPVSYREAEIRGMAHKIDFEITENRKKKKTFVPCSICEDMIKEDAVGSWPDGEGGLLCQLCWESECSKTWWEEAAAHWKEPAVQDMKIVRKEKI